VQGGEVSLKQAVSTVILFLFGSSLVVGINTSTKQDSWISFLISMVMIMPVIFVYGRIAKLYPDKDIFEISIDLFGKAFGKLIIILISVYALHHGALVTRNFSEFFQAVTLRDTPQLMIIIIFCFVAVYLVRSGTGALGRWSVIILPLVFIMIAFTIIFALPVMNFDYVKPVGGQGIKKIFYGSTRSFSFPLGETVLFLAIINSRREKDSPYKLFYYGIIIGGLVLTLAILRNLTILGCDNVSDSYYPSYLAARIINIGNFFTRIEGTISANFILAGLTKVAVSLFAATKGAARIFNMNDYKKLVIPMGLLMIALCDILYKSAIEMFLFIEVYFFYAIPFQIIIPVIIWIAAEIKMHREKVPEE
jgi:spore germination protein KB